MLVGREREKRGLLQALDLARSGQGAFVGLIGEPGIGKSALLAFAVERAHGMRVLRARGIESEAQVPFASLLELLRPALALVDRIPEPQAIALEGALALRPARSEERFAVGAATLSLLACYADEGPVAVIVDDAQWLDESSAQALLFAIRRVENDPLAVVVAVRDGESSLLDGAGLETIRIDGLSAAESETLLAGLDAAAARRLHDATAGNPLALLELGSEHGSEPEGALAPEHAPMLLSARISRAFLRRFGELGERERAAALLAATSETGELTLLGRAAEALGVDLDALSAVEASGLLSLQDGRVEFQHPLARSAIYADAPRDARRAAHRALAGALPDRDVDSRAWHLASAAAGVDVAASSALEHAAVRARERSAHANAAAAFERAGRLAPEREGRGRLLLESARSCWHAGRPERAQALLDEARASSDDPQAGLDADELAGYIAVRRGPVMSGHAVLAGASVRAAPERAVAMLAEASLACFYAGSPAGMLAAAEGAVERMPPDAGDRTRFIAECAIGMARVFGGDASAGAAAIDRAVALAEGSKALHDDLELLSWLALPTIFLRRASTGRALLEDALQVARDRAAIGSLPLMLNLFALDRATTDEWAVAEATYLEAIALARESDQRTSLVFALSGLARLQARRGRERECRDNAAEALALSASLGTRLNEAWAIEALGSLELARGDAAGAAEMFDRLGGLLAELGITDPDMSPAPELVETHLRLGRTDEARALAAEFSFSAAAKGQPWASARASRAEGLVASGERSGECFERALEAHGRTLDAFETARTRLSYGERLRRRRSRVLAREQLRRAAETFERLGAVPWAERAHAELRATGVTSRRRDPTTVDELTPQELQIALLLAGGRTTREAAAALFLSPKTIEYHLGNVYRKLGVHSRDALARSLRDVAGAAPRAE